jgi:hypothetical protein
MIASGSETPVRAVRACHNRGARLLTGEYEISPAEGVIAITMDGDERVYRVWWDEIHDIGRVDWAKGAVCTLPEAQRVLAAVVALGRGKIPVLVDSRGAGSMDRPSRELFRYSQDFASTAILVGSAVNRIVANFFMGHNHTSVPVKVFTLEAEAVSWLHSQS